MRRNWVMFGTGPRPRRRAATALAIALLASAPAHSQTAPDTATIGDDAKLIFDPAAFEAVLGAEESQLEAERSAALAASRSRHVERTPANRYVLPREQIAALNPKHPADLLRHVPGLSIFRNQELGHQISAFGGFAGSATTGTKVLVLIDGHRVNDTGFGGVFWNTLPLSVDELERVEVIYGPESVRYGTGAFAAVVNFVTGPVHGVGERLVQRAGNRGFDQSTYLVSTERERGHSRMLVQREHRNGFDGTSDPARLVGGRFPGGEDYQQWMMRFVDEREVAEGTRLRTGISLVDSTPQGMPFGTASSAGASDSDQQGLLVQMDLDHELSRDRLLRLRGTLHRVRRDFDQPPNPVISGRANNDTRLLDLDLRLEQRWGPWDITTGLGHLSQHADAWFTQGDPSIFSNSLYLQGEREFGDRFVLFAGVRAAFQDLGGDDASWKVAGLYRPRPEIGYRLTVGGSQRQPDHNAARLVEITTLGAINLSPPILGGNEDLQNEEARGFVQVGYEQQWRRSRMKLDVFTARLENLIRLQFDPTRPVFVVPGGAPFLLGGQPAFQLRALNSQDAVRVRGSTLTYDREIGQLELRLALGAQSVTGGPQTYAPNRTGSLVLRWPEDERRWGATMAVTGVGSVVTNVPSGTNLPEHNPGFAMVDLNLTKRLSSRARLDLSVRNLLDRQHKELLVSGTSGISFGREFFVSVSLDL